MAGQVIGTVNVQVGSQNTPKVTTLNYGTRSLKGATDLTLAGAVDGDVITYNANTDSFAVTTVKAPAITNVDAGTF